MGERGERRGYRVERGLVYAAPGGKRLRMTLYLPDGRHRGPRPGIVAMHGGAWIVGTRRQQAWYFRQFARQGIAVMTIEYRKMPKYSFPNCLHDSKAAVRWLRTHGPEWGVDPDRIAAFGASSGGHLAGLLATTRPEDGLEGTENLGCSSAVKCAVALYGSVDLTNFRDMDATGPMKRMGKRFLRKFVGPDERWEGHDAYEAASPGTYATPDSAPVLLVHGDKDAIVPVAQSRTFAETLRNNDVEVHLVEVPGRPHGFDFVYWGERRRILGEMLSFLDTKIGPYREESKNG
ncbi:MAG: alpha/beta hydrolase [bacterium]|nr:alpha/beta hydrolase [bacterium]